MRVFGGESLVGLFILKPVGIFEEMVIELWVVA